MLENPMTYKQIPGWFHSQELYKQAVNHCESKGVFVEVGSFLGSSSVFLGSLIRESNKDIKLFCVDTWKSCFSKNTKAFDYFTADSDEERYKLIATYHKLISEFGEGRPDLIFKHHIKEAGLEDIITPLKMSSVQASKRFKNETLSFVYIDANHSYSHVIDDIQAWMPKVSSSGILGGDDYNWKGVRAAVNELIPNHKTMKDQQGNDITWHT